MKVESKPKKFSKQIKDLLDSFGPDPRYLVVIRDKRAESLDKALVLSNMGGALAMETAHALLEALEKKAKESLVNQ